MPWWVKFLRACSRQCKKKNTKIYIWTVHIYILYRRQCAKYTYIYSVHTVYYKDILSYQYTNTHYTPYVHVCIMSTSMHSNIEAVSSMAKSGTIADIQVSVRQITQQSLVSRWYEMRDRSLQSLLSSDWTLASKMVGRGGRKARRLSLTRTPALFPLFRRRRRFLFCATQTKGSDAVSVNNPPAFKNSKSGLRCATEEPMFKSVSLS